MKSRFQMIWCLSFALSSTIGCLNFCFADGGFFSPYEEDILSPSQKGLIIYENGIETLVLQTSLRGGAEEFAWVVPVPSRPVLSQVDGRIFVDLHNLTKPEIRYIERERHRFGCFGRFGADDDDDNDDVGVDNGVTVVATETVGIYETTTLSATDPGALADWLNENGFYMPPKGERIASAYVEDGWYFITMKIHQSAQQRQFMTEGGTPPIEIKFPSVEMVYPMKLTAVSAEYVELLLYVLAEHKMAYSGANTEFAGWIGSTQQYKTLKKYINKKMYLTKLRSYEALNNEDLLKDIYPYQAINDRPYREVINRYVSRKGTGIDICMASCFLFLLVMRKRKGGS